MFTRRLDRLPHDDDDDDDDDDGDDDDDDDDDGRSSAVYTFHVSVSHDALYT